MSWEGYIFDRYLRKRRSAFPTGITKLSTACEPGRVSIVLPAYNGADYIHEALDSILAQEYQNWELIAVDDGSTDNTGQILDEYACRDERIHVIHQKNQKLPTALNVGFANARGEYFTWTSCDNRLFPNCLQRLVDDLRQHPDWDMVYANIDLIDENGLPLKGSSHYLGYQKPYGSEHISLPQDSLELNIWPNNFIGAALLFRSKVWDILGPFSTHRFTVEDYDYWMRINELLVLRHTSFQQPIYAYRFHAESLTGHRAELKIDQYRQELLVYDDFRRDYFLSPELWCVDYTSETKEFAEQFTHQVTSTGHVIISQDQLNLWCLPNSWPGSIYIRFTNSFDKSPSDHIPAGSIKINVITGKGEGPNFPSGGWDWVIKIGNEQPVDNCSVVSDLPTLMTVLDIKSRSYTLQRLEDLALLKGTPKYRASVIICTHRLTPQIDRCLSSVLTQQISCGEYEVIVVNNSPEEDNIDRRVEEISSTLVPTNTHSLKVVHCPIKGLSFARNAGISHAKGDVLCFIDDDAIAESGWLESIIQAFANHPDVGVVGGRILLQEPEPKPWWFRPAWKRFWSHFDPGYAEYTPVDRWPDYPYGANWNARRSALYSIGGFRTQYGRHGNNYQGGEEIVAASQIQKFGFSIGIEPHAVVIHDIDYSRFSLTHIWKTIQNSRRTWYQAQKDQYIPYELGLAASLKRIINSIRVARLDSLVKPFYTLTAEVWIFAWWVIDFIKRFRKPLTRD